MAPRKKKQASKKKVVVEEEERVKVRCWLDGNNNIVIMNIKEGEDVMNETGAWDAEEVEEEQPKTKKSRKVPLFLWNISKN